MTVVPGSWTPIARRRGAIFSVAAQTAEAVALHHASRHHHPGGFLVTESSDDLRRQVGELADQVRAGLIAGIHLEGPWLARERCGAHDPALLRDPEPAELQSVFAAADGTIRMVTLAPERAGGLEAIRWIVDAGAVAAVGHTEATLRTDRAAVDAGAAVGTHLFNAMRPIHHRDPAP